LSYSSTSLKGKWISAGGAETDPVVGAVNGIVKGSGAGVISAATEADIEAVSGALFGASKVVTAGYLWVADGTDFESVPMSGDVSISTGGATAVGDDTHNHTSTTISGIDISADTNLTAGDHITLTDDDLDVDDDFLLNNGDVGTGTYDFGGATSVEIPNSAAPTVDAAGEIAVDTTDDQLIYYGGAKRVIPYTGQFCFTVENPVDADDNIPIFRPVDALTITGVSCEVDGSSSPDIDVTISDGTNALEAITCDDDGASDDGSITNGTFTANERMEYDSANKTGTVTWLNVCVRYTTDAQ
jgi:hypothetical protein